MEKISIIVPVYNTSKYLNRCIDSLVNQTYKNIEILLVDDGSTDNSRQMCSKWAEKDSRIVCLHKENGGQASARNMGLDHATGDYIAFVDSDDCVSPFYAEKLLNACIDNNVKISFCGYALTDETSLPENMQPSDEQYPVEIISDYAYFERIYTHQEIAYVVVWNKLYHHSIFENLRFTEAHIYEDEGIIHQIIDKCDRIAVSYQPLYFYAMRPGSTMKTKGFRPAGMDVLEFWTERMDYFRTKGWDNLVYFTMKNYLVKCLELYNLIDTNVPDGNMYKKHLMTTYKNMMDEMKKSPVKSKKFVLQMEYYGLFPKKFADVDRNTFLFG